MMMNKLYETFIHKPNKWFDGLQEPKRLFTMLALIVPIIIMAAWSPSLLAIVFLAFLTIQRAIYLGK